MKTLFLVIILFLSIIPTFGTSSNNPINSQNLLKLVEEQLDLGYRIPGSEASLKFKSWIISKINDPWNIKIQNFTYNSVNLYNYVIYKNINYSILIGAHYDTRAIADQDPNYPTNPVPGANDGASGVAAILELMKNVPDTYSDKVGFVLFDAEDQGNGAINGWNWIIGSHYFVDNMSSEEKTRLSLFILLDMIADDDLNIKKEQSSDQYILSDIWSVASDLGYGAYFQNKAGYNLIDDHQPFLSNDIPAVDLIDFDYPEWHTTHDDINAISSKSIAIVTYTVLTWLNIKYDNLTISNYVSSNTLTTNYQLNLTIPVLIIIVYKFSMKKIRK